MKFNKPGIIAAAALGGLMLCGSISNAQTNAAPATPPAAPGGAPGGGGAAGGRNRGQAMQGALNKLDLTADEKTKVAAALQEQRDKQTALRGDTSLSPEDRRAKTKEITDALDAKLKTILTADQYTKWQEVKPAPRTPGGRQGGAGAGGGAPKPAAPAQN